jgi:hypothetical protein
VLLRQKTESVLGALEKPLAAEHARTDGDLGLDDMIAVAKRVTLGVEKGQHPLLLVFL